ncbi:hypothetical protein [Paenibacillus gallinarum]|uniref:Uncharacterized protein n=1 Tax=Paenibacillus gallinarum TaxID=2762232 RepID=A0ABR8T3K2_9BACL|nr:hypothetical protein [Paenibacillus gallinarum]MBD7970159.1 hypothetical protein [Paenibacillus gallinarum]
MNKRDHLEYKAARMNHQEDNSFTLSVNHFLWGLFITAIVIGLMYYFGIPVFGLGISAAYILIINMLLYFIAAIIGKKLVLILFEIKILVK